MRAALQPSANELRILAYYCGVDRFSYVPGNVRLWYELEVDGRLIARSGSDTRCRRSSFYRQDHVARHTVQRRFTFRYDAPGEDASNDEPAVLFADAAGLLQGLFRSRATPCAIRCQVHREVSSSVTCVCLQFQ